MSYQFEVNRPANGLVALRSTGFNVSEPMYFETHAPYCLDTDALIIGHKKLNRVEKSRATIRATFDMERQGLSLDIDLARPTDMLMIARSGLTDRFSFSTNVGRILVGAFRDSIGVTFAAHESPVEVYEQAMLEDDIVSCIVDSLALRTSTKIISYFEDLD